MTGAGMPALFSAKAYSAAVEWIARRAEALVIPLAALIVGMALFSLFIVLVGKSPILLYETMWRGGFGSWFSVQNSLSRAAPLLLAALCVALPARLGLVVIGGEGAIVLGGVAAAAAGTALSGGPSSIVILAMGVAGMAAGGIWIGAVGALRHYRAVNETISSLLMAYIAIALMNQLVEGPLRDPASLNKPSTQPLADIYRIGNIPGMDVHWGLVVGVVACILSWLLIEKTRWGFAARIAGGNVRAAQVQGLAVGPLIVGFTALAGGFAGLAGMLEVAAVQGSANASLSAGYGYTGILVAFLARHNPLAIIPFAILLGGIDASGGLIQRRMDLPDATVVVLQGMIFIVILFSETLYGRFKAFNPDLWKRPDLVKGAA
ncbi:MULTISPECIES: ABC transporter permease [unclassified Mesorhizobium]|uniref:ABC transporter permease n=1 Tax=unclassified Mesorhizobium TaxID=325217 RepID=UPI000FC9BDE6|nr:MULTISPECIES: ABC transporter permease [unclassified Mesorhizobium]RUU66730.1 ABC transporter permease [Mesorhizobium sp. M7A.T.Ca.TU.009.01.1.1]RUU84710.1 ABC transporter permease [Mesorhizobium sp. M7A.T.Ca.TU.009.01.1.2]RUT81435.1 ABC transporter permease [Mesorhizobium sp. M7A.T.Ca.US.000.02.1.1]RUT92845.1 ABC transporter permease [Mesorhizobium sp. M7A.T.Ca.US.000.02.2.1]RUT99063.1 ABC transporter permease [Mesorhizobium sp. M7A.T.Ca.TU.009.02.1.1]